MHETFQQPVAAYFDDQRIILHPEDVDFDVDVNSMVAEAVPYGQGIGFWRPFLREVFDQPARPVDVPLKYELNEDKLAAWLDEVAIEHDQAAKPPYGVALAPGTPFTSTFMFQAGEPGLELEKAMSAQRVVQALTSSTAREAKFVLVEVPRRRRRSRSWKSCWPHAPSASRASSASLSARPAQTRKWPSSRISPLPA